jgi:peptide/nickel transport system ATP-binding protein
MKKKQIQNLRGKEISMIFQDPTASLNPVFKIGTQIKDTIKYSLESNQRNKSKKIIYKKSIEALKDCSLPDPERIMDNYPFQLSGGMRQRICIAMALATAEDFLIADEPTTNLDVTIQSQVLDLIKKLVEEKNTTLILITHSLGVAREMTDRIYVMYAGEIVESAKTKDIFNKAYHPYTVGLLNAVPKLSGDKKLEGIDGRITSYLNPPNGCRYAPRCDNAKLICHDEKPTFKKVGDEHYIACHLVEKNAGEKNE